MPTDPVPPRSFRDRVIAEALRQKEHRLAGRPIPSGDRRYARIAGLAMTLAAGAGAAATWAVGNPGGGIAVGALLFFGVIGVAGLAQVVTGLHLLSRR